ncbi:small GTPase EhRabX34, putative [Entamoeba histolytica HM-3:IMSS]|uniref:Rab family GTPase n=5 Tax=Entamoeba histolytica TaxID=5759 RepID=A0A8U0WPW6_ENTH1|eukprot:XP_650332.1 Rab family GTPase [Entamoeba histolytica HM-1:IMSS]
MTEKKDWDYLLKFLIIGDTAVGKTAMLLRYTDNTFTDAFIATIGVDFKVKKMEVNGKRLKIQVVSGQEKFHTITQSYYRGSHAVIIVYDCTDKKTFESTKNWLAETEAEIAGSAVRLLVGNKCDMPKQVSTEEGQSFANCQHVHFMEVSAKTNTNIAEAFNYLINEVVKKLEGNSKQLSGKANVNIKESKKTKSKCFLF